MIELISQGGSCSTWEEANLDAPKQLTETLHENGKVNGAGGKAEEKTSTLNDYLPVIHNTRAEPREDM